MNLENINSIANRKSLINDQYYLQRATIDRNIMHKYPPASMLKYDGMSPGRVIYEPSSYVVNAKNRNKAVSDTNLIQNLRNKTKALVPHSLKSVKSEKCLIPNNDQRLIDNRTVNRKHASSK